jgi:hypothetical protein
VSEIGSDSNAALAVGVLALPPFFDLSVRANTILETAPAGNEARLAWLALAIGTLATGAGAISAETANAARPAMAAGPAESDLAFFAVNNTAFALSRFRLTAVGTVRERQITISANQMRHDRNLAVPMVAVIDSADASVVFSDNQCRLDAFAPASGVAVIAAPRVVVANNVVRHRSDTAAMNIFVGDGGAATVLGNLSFGNIRLNGNDLSAPFDALNLIAQ